MNTTTNITTNTTPNTTTDNTTYNIYNMYISHIVLWMLSTIFTYNIVNYYLKITKKEKMVINEKKELIILRKNLNVPDDICSYILHAIICKCNMNKDLLNKLNVEKYKQLLKYENLYIEYEYYSKVYRICLTDLNVTFTFDVLPSVDILSACIVRNDKNKSKENIVVTDIINKYRGPLNNFYKHVKEVSNTHFDIFNNIFDNCNVEQNDKLFVSNIHLQEFHIFLQKDKELYV